MTIYKMRSGILNQICTIKEDRGHYEMLCDDGVKYNNKELAFIYLAQLRAKKDGKKLAISQQVHTVKKIFEGEIIRIDDR